jgi:cytochrome c
MFLNSRGGSLSVPPPPAAPAEASGEKAAAEAESADAQKATNEPVPNEAQAAKGANSLSGEGAPGDSMNQ